MVIMTVPRAISVALLAISLSTLSAQASTMKLGEVLRLTPSTTAEGGSAQEHRFQADRGSRKGQHLRVWSGAINDARTAAMDPATSEYQLVGSSAVGPLPDVDVLGIHYLKVRPDRREAFEKFVASTLHPAVGSLRPDLRLLYYKAVRGPRRRQLHHDLCADARLARQVLAGRRGLRCAAHHVRTGEDAHQGAADVSGRGFGADR
jgi:hypothetical protein